MFQPNNMFHPLLLVFAVFWLLVASSSSSSSLLSSTSAFVIVPSRRIQQFTVKTFRLSATDDTATAAAVAATVAIRKETVAKKNPFESTGNTVLKGQGSAYIRKKKSRWWKKKNPPPPPPQPKKKGPAPLPSLPIDISRLDIRVGLIAKAWIYEGERQLFYCTDIDFGYCDNCDGNDKKGLGTRQLITTGPFPEASSPLELVGHKVLVVVNIKPKKISGFLAHGKVLCARKYGGKEFGKKFSEEDIAVEFVVPHPESQIGDCVLCEGYNDTKNSNKTRTATANYVQKKKLIKRLFPDLKINNEGIAVYQGKQLYTIAKVTTTLANLSLTGRKTTKTAFEKVPCTAMSLTNVRIA